MRWLVLLAVDSWPGSIKAIMRKAAIARAFAQNDSGLLKQPARVDFDPSVTALSLLRQGPALPLGNLSPARTVSTSHSPPRQGTLLCAMKPVRRCSMTKLAVLTSA